MPPCLVFLAARLYLQTEEAFMTKLVRFALHALFLTIEPLIAFGSMLLIEDAAEGENFYCFVFMWLAILLFLAHCAVLMTATSPKTELSPQTRASGVERRRHSRVEVMASLEGNSKVAA
jgi:cytochrome bd-type quinol oxidase subunit 2